MGYVKYFRGIFVSGSMPIQMTIIIEIAFGYPLVVKILDVTSSMIRSPNISNPTTAIDKLSRYYSLISAHGIKLW